jgi:hypothetical protein
VPVRATRLRADAAQLLGGVVGRVLDGLGLVEHDLAPLDLLEGVDVAHRGAVGGDDHVGVGDLGLASSSAGAGSAPWWTTTRRPG